MPEKLFELMGGALCLDFVNTIHVYGAVDPREELHTFGDLVTFAQQSGAITRRQADEMIRGIESSRANRTLSVAKDCREAMYHMFSAIAAGKTPPVADLEIFNKHLARALPNLRVRKKRHSLEWTWNEESLDPERVLWPIVRSAAELLTSTETELIRECGSETCTWMFLDRSKNRTRLWCDMKKCGNRAKWRRYYDKHKTNRN